MKQLKKMIDHLKSKSTKSPNDRTPSLFKVLAACLFAGVFAMPTAVNAQATGCLANETAQTISFATPAWTAGSAGPITYNAAAAAGTASATVSATVTNIFSAAYPATAQSGGFADAFYYYINRPSTAGSNIFTITFSKPVRNLNITATDIDTIDLGAGGVDGGKYQDAVTFTGNGPSGAVIPTATSGALVTVVGNTATAASTGTTATNCAAASALCNAVFNYTAPITSLTMTYSNGPLAAGDPPAQVVGVANIGFCVQNPDLSLVKDDAGASFTAGSTGSYTFTVNNTGSAATSGTTTVKDILPAGMSFGTPLTPGGANAAAWTCARSTTTNTNDTATCTSTAAIAAAGGSTFTLPVAVALTATGTLTNRAKVFGGGDPNKAAETTTGTIAACPSDSLAGAVANAGCGFETTPILPPTTDMQAALGATTPAVVSPGQVISGLTATCTNIGTNPALTATCVPSVSIGTISALACVPASPQASLAAGAAIVCTYTYTAPGTAGGLDEATTAVTFTATTSATNDSVPANNVATIATTVIDAVNDTANQPGGTVGATTNLATNDQFPAGAVFTLQPGSTCVAPVSVSTAGVATYSVPVTGTCVVNYQVCTATATGTPPEPCDQATLTVNAAGADISVTQPAAPLVSSPGSIVNTTITCTNSAAGTAIAATCGATAVDSTGAVVPVTVGVCTPVPPTTVAPNGTIVCPVSYVTPGTAGGTNTVPLSVTLTGTTGAANDTNAANNTAPVVRTIIDAVSDVDTKPASTLGATTPLGGNDQFPVGSVFAIQPGSTCAAPVSVSPVGVATYSMPATGSCTVNYQVCAPAPNATVCDTATLTVTGTALPVIAIAAPVTVAEGTAAQNVITLSAASATPVTVTLTTTFGTASAADIGAQTYSVDGGTTFLPVPVSGILTIPAGVTSVQVRTATIVDGIAESAETFSLTLSAPSGVVLGAPGTQTVQNTISAEVVLSVTKTASQTLLAIGKPGQFYTITIAVANGPTTAAVTIADVMPAGVTLSATPTATGGVLSGCPTTGVTLLGCTIATNTSGPVVITVPVTVGAAAAGKPAVNSATVSGGGDLTCPAAAHCTGTVTSTVAAPDMQVTPSTSLPPAVKDVPYPPNQTITCTNVSTVDAANAFCRVTDLPPGLISTCTPASPVALLPAGEKIVCTISGTPTVTAPIKAKVVTGADGDSISTNNEGVLVSTAAALSVAKTVSANPLIIGAVNQYYSISITVTNGPTIEPISLNDNFATGITTSGPVSISGGTFKTGSCAAANSAGATTLTGCQIEAGVTGTVYINVPILVAESAEGPSGGNNTVTASGGGDPACPGSASCVGSTGSVAVIYGDLGSLFIRKVADRTTAEIGDVITYKVTVRSTKIKGTATVEDHLPIGFRLISNTTRIVKGGVLTAASDPAGAPGPDLTFNVQIPAIDQDVEIEYKVRVGLGADRGDGINSAQASMVRGRLRSLIAKAKVKVIGGVFTREACIVGKVYADCNGNAMQDKGEPSVPGVTLYLEDGTSMTTDENGQYSICGVRAITHVLKVDNKTLPKDAKLGITSNRNVGDPNTLFVDVLAGQLHNTEFRLDSCSPQILQNIEMRQKGQTGSSGSNSVSPPTGGVQFDSAQPKILGSGLPQPATKTVEAGGKP
jgi:uncharacterized repeat protein (TIGR01451 family)